MINPRKYQGPLPKELPMVVIIVCPNFDSLHTGPTLNYIIFGRGVILDDPEYHEFLAIRETYNVPTKFLYVPCAYCRSKGIKGVSHFSLP